MRNMPFSSQSPATALTRKPQKTYNISLHEQDLVSTVDYILKQMHTNYVLLDQPINDILLLRY